MSASPLGVPIESLANAKVKFRSGIPTMKLAATLPWAPLRNVGPVTPPKIIRQDLDSLAVAVPTLLLSTLHMIAVYNGTSLPLRFPPGRSKT